MSPTKAAERHAANSTRSAARRAGLIYFVFMIGGLLGEFVLPSAMVPGDAGATARNIVSGELTYRIGVLTSFVGQVLFLFLVSSLYGLFREVDRGQARLMVLLVTVGVAVSLSNMILRFVPLALLGGEDYWSAFSPAQRDALALGFLKAHGSGTALSIGFWGLWLFPFGLLVVRSGFIPRILGVLLWVAGVAYVVASVMAILLPEHRQAVFRILMPLYFGEVPIIFWLLIKGAREPKPAALPAG